MTLEGDSSAAAPAEVLAADTPSPSGRAVAREEDEGLERALAQLPEDYRQVILLRYQEERSFDQIGELMARSPNTARKLWLRAVERLRHELEGSP